MKIITNKKYNDLLNKMRKETHEALENLQKEHDKEISAITDEYEMKNKKLKRDMGDIILDHGVEIRRIKESQDVVVLEKTKELKESLAKVTSERDNYKKECEILTKAFENLGFDVKDMKEILNKLVDGVVSKNTIQLVK